MVWASFGHVLGIIQTCLAMSYKDYARTLRAEKGNGGGGGAVEKGDRSRKKLTVAVSNITSVHTKAPAVFRFAVEGLYALI